MTRGHVRIRTALYADVIQDLARRHSHAHERVGFAFGKVGPCQGREPFVYIYRYEPVPDDMYIESATVGALIDDRAILSAMQEVRHHRGQGESCFHVHIHRHEGQPRFSLQDQQSLPKLIPGLRRMEPAGAHGLLLLSTNHGIAQVWWPGCPDSEQATSISMIGAPIMIFSAEDCA
jgi:hypothetical protein